MLAHCKKLLETPFFLKSMRSMSEDGADGWWDRVSSLMPERSSQGKQERLQGKKCTPGNSDKREIKEGTIASERV